MGASQGHFVMKRLEQAWNTGSFYNISRASTKVYNMIDLQLIKYLKQFQIEHFPN